MRAFGKALPAVLVAVAALTLAGCATARQSDATATTGAGGSTSSTASGDPSTTATSSSVPTTTPTTPTTPPPTTTTAPPPTTTTTPAENPANFLQEGSTGPKVLALQQRLTSLGYWLGTPNGDFGDSTQQAVYAYQKAAGIERDGIVGPKTEAALALGIRPTPRSNPGNLPGYMIQVDLADDLVMFVDQGKLEYILNTSTGGGYTYNDGDGTAIAETPTGVFHTYREVDGLVTDNLGQLWMPKFFTGGFAIHGDSYVPPEPVSHGCVRVSNEAIEWIWAQNLDPIGTTVWVY
jgi:peptidoglycan hydrolase-like protein with peptidoglycan-binding domain